MEKLFWIGPRESDILGLESIYSGSITLYGSNSGDNISYCAHHGVRINHNIDHPDSSAFILHQQLTLIQQYPNCKFMYYNPNYVHGVPDAILNRTICLNPNDLLETLNDKKKFRALAQLRHGEQLVVAYLHIAEADEDAVGHSAMPDLRVSKRQTGPGHEIHL